MAKETGQGTRRQPLLAFALLLVIAGLAFTLFAGDPLGIAPDIDAHAFTVEQERILASTIQIKLYDEVRIEAGREKLYTAQGLGTLIQYDGRQYILTHNHWPMTGKKLRFVELRNAAGRHLLTIDGAAFLALVRYHDAGTILMQAPRQLTGLTAAPLGNGAAPATGDKLLLAIHDAQNAAVVVVASAEVAQSGIIDMPGKLQVRVPRTAVVPGDSGGGVWHEGKLIGNLWAIVETVRDMPNGQLGETNEPRRTGFVLAAPQPLAGVESVTAADLEQELVSAPDFERGPGR